MADWAFVVGINIYGADSGLKDLAGAVADAAAFGEWLLDPNGGNVDPAHLFFWSYGYPDAPGPRMTDFLADPTPWPHLDPDFTRAPTVNEISMAIDKVATNARLADADRLYVFLAGHGFQTASRDYVDVPQTCFVAGDYHPDLAAGGLLPCDDMMRMLESQGPREIVFFLDACRTDASRRVTRPVGLWNIRAHAGVHQRQAIGRAAQPKELAYEVPIDTPVRGAFSQLLVEGLSQHRVGGVLTVQALDEYVSQAMPGLVAPYSQFPEIKEIPRPYQMVLAQAVVGPLPVVQLSFNPAHAGQDFLIVGGPANMRIVVTAGDEPYAHEFPPGFYVVETLAGDEVASFNHTGPGVTDVST